MQEYYIRFHASRYLDCKSMRMSEKIGWYNNERIGLRANNDYE